MILGVQHQQKSNFEEAKKIYQNILKIDPNQATVANNLGLVFVALEEYQEAKVCYEKAIELDPNHPGAKWEAWVGQRKCLLQQAYPYAVDILQIF